MTDELRQAYDVARDRLFHGTSHFHYGLRQCGPNCIGCSRLKVAMLATIDAMERGDRAVMLLRRDIKNFPQEKKEQ